MADRRRDARARGRVQFSALKDRCLTECRHPGAFLLRHYRRGPAAASRSDAGTACSVSAAVGRSCCVMFVAGVANLMWMAGAHRADGLREDGSRGARRCRQPGSRCWHGRPSCSSTHTGFRRRSEVAADPIPGAETVVTADEATRRRVRAAIPPSRRSRPASGEGVVERCRGGVGVAECVGDPEGGDRVVVAAGVADERPGAGASTSRGPAPAPGRVGAGAFVVAGSQPTVMAFRSRMLAAEAPTWMRTRPVGVTHASVPTSQ